MLFSFSILLYFSTAIVFAAETKLVTSVGLKQEYNDNILYTKNDKNDDFISSVIPSLKLTHATEILNLSAQAGWEALFYWDNSDLDTINQRYRLNGNYRLTERWSLSATGRVVYDTTLDTHH